MKNSSFKAPLVLSAIAALLLSGACGFLFTRIRAADADAESLASERALAETQITRLAALKASLDATASGRAKLDSYLIGKDKVVSFLEEVEKAGTADGVEVKIDSVADDTFAFASSTAPVFRIALEGSGTWKQAFLLAEQIRALPHKIAFTSIGLQKISDGALDKKGNPVAGSPAQWKASLELVAAKTN